MYYFFLKASISETLSGSTHNFEKPINISHISINLIMINKSMLASNTPIENLGVILILHCQYNNFFIRYSLYLDDQIKIENIL